MQSELSWTYSHNGYYSADTKEVVYLLMPRSDGVEVDWRFLDETGWRFGHDGLVVGTLDEAKHWCEMHAAVGV